MILREFLYREGFKNWEMARRRPNFESGEAGAEAAKFKKFSAEVPENASFSGWGAGGSQNLWLSDAARTNFRITSGIKRQGEENILRFIFSSPELIKKAPKALKNPEIDLFG